MREGAPQDQQARLARLELQQSPDARLGQQRPHHVLGALQRRHADQELVRGGAREIVAQVAGRHLWVDVALLDLQRQSVVEMREQRVIECGAGPHAAAFGELARRAHRFQRDHLDAVLVAAGADLVGDVAHLERMGVHALLGDEGADPATRTSTPSSASSRSARLAVMRETVSARVSSFSDGTRSPARSAPAAMRSRMKCLTCR